MTYSELAYFEGHHVAHIAAWCEHRRLVAILVRNRQMRKAQPR